MSEGSVEEASVVGDELVGADPQRTREVNRIERSDGCASERDRAAKEIVAHVDEHAGREKLFGGDADLRTRVGD